MIFLFNCVIFRFHVNFQGCKLFLLFNAGLWWMVFNEFYMFDLAEYSLIDSYYHSLVGERIYFSGNHGGML